MFDVCGSIIWSWDVSLNIQSCSLRGVFLRLTQPGSKTILKKWQLVADPTQKCKIGMGKQKNKSSATKGRSAVSKHSEASATSAVWPAYPAAGPEINDGKIRVIECIER